MAKEPQKIISDSFINLVCSRLADNKQVRRSLPVWGRLHIDRQLPFICVCRQKPNEINQLSSGLITGEASYLRAIATRTQHEQLSYMVKNIARTMKQVFGSFLIIEVWISDDKNNAELSESNNDIFKIFKPARTEISSTVDVLATSLKKIELCKKLTEVEIISSAKTSPPGLQPLIANAEAAKWGFHVIGIEVRPVYMDRTSNQAFPMLYRKIRKGFAQALKNACFEFAQKKTISRPAHFHSMGRHSMVKAVWEVDKQLANLTSNFDFLLKVSPVNAKAAWSSFQRGRFQKAPTFIYRPLSVDPALAKRTLFKIPIERIEDPTLAQIFHEQQLELDRKFSMLHDIDTPNFLYGSLQLYGKVDEPLLNTANKLLTQISPHSRDESLTNAIGAKAFAARAEEELNYFRKFIPEINTKIIIRNDILGLMVSRGNLLIGTDTKIPVNRVEALIAHEVGTHVLTYLNGKSQRLHQLYLGLANYDELQEGLAVLAEFMVSGLTGTRMRLLAARVIAAHQMVDGADFVEVFHSLNKDYAFEQRTAFNICVRTFRGGGLTKDAIYLRGLVKLLEYIRNGGKMKPLFVGKISVEHIAIIQELQWRKVLKPTPMLPRHFENPDILDKINILRSSNNILDLINRRK